MAGKRNLTRLNALSKKSKSKEKTIPERIRDLFKGLEFDKTDGLAGTLPASFSAEHQPDIIAGWENSVLVVKCESIKSPKDTETCLKAFKKSIPEIENGLSSHPTYKKYSDRRYILFPDKAFDWTKEDTKNADSGPKVYLWNEEVLKYYENLYKCIKSYAKFELLGEIGVEPLDKDPIKVPAFRTTLDGVHVYHFAIDPKDLLKFSFVARREKGNEQFYQRIIDPKRMEMMSSFVDSGGKFPNNIIIAFKEGATVDFSPKPPFNGYSVTEFPFMGIEFGFLKFPRDYRSCWIIDGQHRLYAFATTTRSFHMQVFAFEGLPIAEQAGYFLDINRNQKPVNPDLLWDLYGEMIPDQSDGRISNIVKTINGTGSLSNSIYIPSLCPDGRKERLKLSAICIAIKKRRLVEDSTNGKNKNPLYTADENEFLHRVSKSLSAFFDCVKHILPENWNLGQRGFVVSNGGIGVMISLYQKILEHRVGQDGKQPTKHDFERFTEPVKEVLTKDYGSTKLLKTLRLRCTSEGGKNEVLREFVAEIRRLTGDSKFGGEDLSVQSEEFTKLEGTLKQLVNKVMSQQHGPNWLTASSYHGILNQCQDYLKKQGLQGKMEPYTQLTLGALSQIIDRNESLFSPIFVNKVEEFCSWPEFKAAMTQLTRVRNTQMSHSTGIKKRKYEEEQSRIYLYQMKKCFDRFYSKRAPASIP